MMRLLFANALENAGTHVSAERNATIGWRDNVLRSPVRASSRGEQDRWSGRRAVTSRTEIPASSGRPR